MDLSKVRSLPTREELNRLKHAPVERVDLSEIPELESGFWKSAERNPYVRFTKQQVTVRLDARVLDWLKKDGRGYQTRLNDVLRQAMLKDMVKSHRKAS